MTVLSVTAVSMLVERHVREHHRIGLDALVLLLAAVDVSAPRAHAGIARAISRGRIATDHGSGAAVLVAVPMTGLQGSFKEPSTHAREPEVSDTRNDSARAARWMNDHGVTPQKIPPPACENQAAGRILKRNAPGHSRSSPRKKAGFRRLLGVSREQADVQHVRSGVRAGVQGPEPVPGALRAERVGPLGGPSA